MSPQRLALLIAALFALSSTLFVASARYPDEEYGLTLEQAQAVDEIRQRDGSQFVQEVVDPEDPERPYAAAYLHNFPARLRLIIVGIVAALALSAAAFGRRFDRPDVESDERGEGPGASAILPGAGA